MRKVGAESSKTYEEKLNNGFFDKYCKGDGLDIGGKGYTNSESILSTAILVDLDFPNYNGLILPFKNESQDYIYNSHTLEHIDDYKLAIQEWFRVLKPGGYIITIVPHRDLYEKKLSLPSNFNADHKHFFISSSLIKCFEESLTINSFRVRHLQDNDFGHNYKDGSDIHGRWLYEIEMVIQKL